MLISPIKESSSPSNREYLTVPSNVTLTNGGTINKNGGTINGAVVGSGTINN
jgi:hypothetical protein